MKSRSSLALAGALALGCFVGLAWWLARERGAPATPIGAEHEGAAALIDSGPALSAPTSAEPSALPAGVEREAPVPASRLLARVEHRITHAPLPGFDAELVGDGLVLGHDTSDARGRIFLPLPPEQGATVRLEAPEGWSVLAPQRFVRADAADELVFVAGPAGSERFRAQLLDAASGEPLRDYMLRLGTRDGRREQLVSDANGLVASAVDYPEGTLLLFCYDEYGPELGGELRKPLHYLELEHTIEKALAGPHELRLEVGPTYRLELEGPPAALEAPLTADLRYLFEDSSPRPAPGWFVVRAGSPPWVRFPANRSHFADHGQVALTVSSRDGRWFGSTRVAGTTGVHDVPMVLTAQGIVVVRVLDPEGNGIPGALVQLHPLLAGQPQSGIARQESAGNGLAEFRFMPSGPYAVSAAAPRFERRFATLEVNGEERSDATLTLPRVLSTLTIAGQVKGFASKGQTVRLFLRSVRPDTGLLLERDLTLERAGKEVHASFEFADLAPGDYMLGGHAWFVSTLQPSVQYVSAGTRGIVLQLVDGGDDAWRTLVVRDSAGGEPLRKVWTWLVEREQVDGTDSHTSPPHVLLIPPQLAPDARLGVVAPGYRVSYVHLGRLSESGDANVLEVQLERGWSGEILAQGPGFAALTGVRVLLDGDLAGTTDAQGRLELVRERAPQRIELDYRGWLVEPDSWNEVADLAAGRRGHARVLFTPQ